MPSKAARDVYRRLIEAVYRKWNVEKINEIPQIMEKYKGQEDEVYDKVVRKYVFCHKENVWRPLVEAMYRRFNEAKLQDLPQILSKYKRSEAALYRALCNKYIPGLRKGDAPPELDVWEDMEPVAEMARPVSPFPTKEAEEASRMEPPTTAEPEAEPASAPVAASAKTPERTAAEHVQLSAAELFANVDAEYAAEGRELQAALGSVSVQEDEGGEEQDDVDAPPLVSEAEEDPAEPVDEPTEAGQRESEQLPAEPAQGERDQLANGLSGTVPAATADEGASELAVPQARRQHRVRRREARESGGGNVDPAAVPHAAAGQAAVAGSAEDGATVQLRVETKEEREARRAARRLRHEARKLAGEQQPQGAVERIEAPQLAQEQRPDENGNRIDSDLHQGRKRGLEEAETAATANQAETAVEGPRHRTRKRRAEAQQVVPAVQQPLSEPHAQRSSLNETAAVAGDEPVDPVMMDREQRRSARRQARHEARLLAIEQQPDENGNRHASSDLRGMPAVAGHSGSHGPPCVEGQRQRKRRRRDGTQPIQQPLPQSLEPTSTTGELDDLAERPFATRPKASRRPPPRLTTPTADIPAAASEPTMEQPTAVQPAMVQPPAVQPAAVAERPPPPVVQPPVVQPAAVAERPPPPVVQPPAVQPAAVAERPPLKSEWEKAWEAKQGQAAVSTQPSSSSSAVPGTREPTLADGTAASKERPTTEAQQATKTREAELKRKLQELLQKKRLRLAAEAAAKTAESSTGLGTAVATTAPVGSTGEAPQPAVAEGQPPLAVTSEASVPPEVPVQKVRRKKRDHQSSHKAGFARSSRRVYLAPASNAETAAAPEPPRVTLRTGQEAAMRAKALQLLRPVLSSNL